MHAHAATAPIAASACVRTHTAKCRKLLFGLTFSAADVYALLVRAVFCGASCVRTALERWLWMAATVGVGVEVLERSIGSMSEGSGLLQPAFGVRACRVRW